MAIQIQRKYVYIGSDVAQVSTIKCVADTAGSLGAKYLLFHTPAGLKHYAWFNTGASVDPAPAGGWVGHAVVITSGDTASEVATALSAVLTAVTGFDSTAVGDTVTLTSTVIGWCMPPRDADLTASKTNFSFAVTVLGQAEESAGCVQGDIEISNFEVSKLEVKCHATGSTIQQEIPIGLGKPEVSFTLQDTDKSKIERIFNMMGFSSSLAVGADKGNGFGFGTGIIGASTPLIKVKFHAVEADASDKSGDWHMWKTNITVDSFTFASEDVATIPVTFSCYPDATKKKEYDVIFIGNEADAIPA
jgi:hypothetical protein